MSITATISYRLSQAGRQDSLRKGGDGRKEQTQIAEVQPNDVELFVVDEDGNASFDATRCVSHVERATDKFHRIAVFGRRQPIGWSEIEWDIAPTWGDLLELARWVHDELRDLADEQEDAYDDEQLQQEAEQRAAQANFLNDPNARAEKVEEQCVTIAGIDFWDPAVVEEAKRRWASDRDETKQENRRTLAAWISEHGTDNQRQRLDAGLLPWQEASDSLEKSLFEPLAALPLYQRFDPAEVCKCTEVGEAAVACKVTFKSFDATALTAEEWDRYAQIRDTVPDAQFQLREHQAVCVVADPQIRRGVIVKRTVGRLTYKREYALTVI